MSQRAVLQAAQPAIRLEAEPTAELLAWAAAIEASDASTLEKARQLATGLGARPGADGLTQIGFWTPELSGDVIQPKNILLEVFTPIEPIDPGRDEQTVRFRRDYVQLEKQGDYQWGVLNGLQAGTTQAIGSLYWLRYLCPDTNGVLRVGDPMGSSYPFGVYAPAEVYDVDALQRRRADLPYYEAMAAAVLRDAAENEPPCPFTVPAPSNILQLHVRTASPNGYVSGLTALYRELARKLRHGEPLTPAETNLIGYDAVQLLPIEPTVEVRAGQAEDDFFSICAEDGAMLDSETEGLFRDPNEVRVRLRRPDLQNWGYDVVIFGSAATNPALLETLRPDELVDFVAELHNFPTGPIRLIYDLVYGHADNQALDLLNVSFLKGPNMYGQDVNHQNPGVRAILLEMQRRKVSTGADGIRIDGGQDFKYFNPLTEKVDYDDPYLLAMGDLVQEIGPARWRPFVIYEDGRPWPAEGWEEVSTYRDLVELRPDSFQWGPLIFAHNTPALQGFWARKWRRVCEKMQFGAGWITGCGNHDTLRRGTQVAASEPINLNLGATLPEVLANAYDNPSIGALTYGFSPGLPMDFIHCLMRAPWGFFRNTDDRFGVKVVAEEAPGFLDWQVTPELYGDGALFSGLKRLGFATLEDLRGFLTALTEAIKATDYDLELTATACQGAAPAEPSGAVPTVDVAWLKAFARRFMEDMHAACNVWLHADRVEPERAAHNLALRQLRRERPWLRHNLRVSEGVSDERLDLLTTPCTTIFYGLRRDPQGSGAVALVAHMGGEPMAVRLPELFPTHTGGWTLLLASPGLAIDAAHLEGEAFTLADSQALILEPLAAGDSTPAGV
ncbi:MULTISPECIES: glucosylglycerol hydrolase [Aphanothece]|uniref:glucosylglycerol hydrolase n=1 Tax=Aphanothece TaxID=1121 RepID=UPI003984B5EA